MKIEKFVTGIISTNCYIVTNEETKETVIVDPANLSKAMIGYIEEEELVIKAILLTHAHFDHIMGIDKVIDRYGEMPVYVEESDLELLHTPSMNESTVYTNGYSYPGGDVIHDGDVLHLIGEDFRVIHTPGHTQGGVSYYVEKEGVLFSGDTLFCCSVGRSDFATSSTSALIRSIKEKLFLLPDETKVFPGHMGATTIGNEKVNNPYVNSFKLMNRISCKNERFTYDMYHIVKSFLPDAEISQKVDPEQELLIEMTAEEEPDLEEQACDKKVRWTFFHCREAEIADISEKREQKRYINKKLYQTLVKKTGEEHAWGNMTGVRPTKMIMERLSFMNITIDNEKNEEQDGTTVISGEDSAITMMKIPTNEELMIARDVMELKNKKNKC